MYVQGDPSARALLLVDFEAKISSQYTKGMYKVVRKGYPVAVIKVILVISSHECSVGFVVRSLENQ